MQDHYIGVAVEFALVRRRRFHENIEHPLGDFDMLAVQGVVEAFRDLKERLLAVDDIPIDVEADFVHQRNQAVENLRHAAAAECRVDLLHSAALEIPGQAADVVDLAGADDRGVGVEIQLAHFDTLASTNSAIFAFKSSRP